MKLRERPISAVLVEAALTGFRGNISIVGSTVRESIAIDVYVEEGVITHCAGYLGDKEVIGDECLEIVMSTECVNCGAELTRLPPERIVRRCGRPILSREPVISDLIDSASKVLRERVRTAEIVLKGRMVLFVRARVEDGLRALAALSAGNATAMLATAGDNRLVVVSSEGRVTAAYLKLEGDEYMGLEALSKASQGLGDHALIQIFSLPEEMARILIEGVGEGDTR